MADAAIRRVFPGTVAVAISERQPMGIGRIGDDLYLIDDRGGIIDEFGPNYAEFDLPIIDGLAAAPRDDGPLDRRSARRARLPPARRRCRRTRISRGAFRRSTSPTSATPS